MANYMEGDDYGYVKAYISPQNTVIKISPSSDNHEINENHFNILIMSEKEISIDRTRACLGGKSDINEQGNDNSYIEVMFRIGESNMDLTPKKNYKESPPKLHVDGCKVDASENSGDKIRGFCISTEVGVTFKELWLNFERVVSKACEGTTPITINFNNVLIEGEKCTFAKTILIDKKYEEMPVKINKFYANEQTVGKGQSTLLKWESIGATFYDIEPCPSEFKANTCECKTDTIFKDTTYKLTAIGKNGWSAEKELTIYVEDEANIKKHDVKRSECTIGRNKKYDYTFAWSVEDADSVSVYWCGENISNAISGTITKTSYNYEPPYPEYGFKIIAKRKNDIKVWPEE